MSVQNINTQIDTEVDVPADLTTLKSGRLADGYRAMVKVFPSASHGLWILDKNDTTAANGVTVVLTDLGLGFGTWHILGSGPPGPAGISVNTEALLTAFTVTTVTDGAIGYVGNPVGGLGQSQDSLWQLITQVGGAPALSAHQVIASTVAGRVWERLTNIVIEKWAQQATWFVDPAAGDDQNDGATNASGLKTHAELTRRVPVLKIPITITFVGVGTGASQPDVPSWSPVGRWDPTLSATQASISYFGVETAAALPAGATGIVNTATNGTAATNTSAQLTDTGGAGVVWPVGSILRVTDGPSVGAWTTIVKDEGGGVARISRWVNSVGNLVTPPLNGNHYSIVTLTSLPDFFVTCVNGTVKVQSCSFVRWKAMENGFVPVRQSFYQLTFCEFPSTVTFISPLAPAVLVFFSSKLFNAGGIIGGHGVNIIATGCAISTVGGAAWRGDNQGSRNAPTLCTFQGTPITVGQSTAAPNMGGTAQINDCAFFDCATPAIVCQRGGQCLVTVALWGAGNAVQGVQVRSGGHFWVRTPIIPTLAAAGQELEVDALAAPATWAAWNAAPYNRNFVNAAIGSSVLDAA